MSFRNGAVEGAGDEKSSECDGRVLLRDDISFG